jgi:hypothetical protein
MSFSNWDGGNGLTNKNTPLAISTVYTLPTPSHMALTWHSGTEVVTSGFLQEQDFLESSLRQRGSRTLEELLSGAPFPHEVY